MKILYFSYSYSPHDFRFLSAIVEGGHQAYFVRLHKQLPNQTTLPLPIGAAEVAWPGNLRSVITQVAPDLIHAGPVPSCGYLAAKTRFQPTVLMSWGSDLLREARRNPFARWRASYALRHAASVIGDCKAVRSVAVSLGTPEARIVTFPWGVDLKRFNPRGGDGGLRARLGWQDKFVLLHLRAWEPLYDPLTVAKAFAQAAKREPNLRLLLPGAGSLASQISRVLEQQNVLDRVHMPGLLTQAELPALYRAADLYVSASQSDGSSVSLIEALASGLPALVSEIPGNREWVRPGEEGWLFPVKDQTELADLILQAAAQPGQLKRMSGQARRKAEERADWTKNKQGLFKAYELALRSAA